MAPPSQLCQILAVPLLLFSCVFALPQNETADTVFHNGSIYSLNDRSSKYQAMAIKDGYIQFLGSNGCIKPFIGPQTTVFDLEGRMAMPGLIDAHMHLISGGASLLACNLNYQPLDLEEILDHIQGCLDQDTESTDQDWLQVVSLDWYTLSDLTGGVTFKELDTLNTKRPIIVSSADRHSHWVNSAALKASDITASTQNPSGGVVERLPGGREPSGVLQDNAQGLLSGPAPATPEDNVNSAKAALKLLREQGVTGFQDANSNAVIATAFESVRAEGALSARGYFDWQIDAPNSTAEITSLVNRVVNATTRWNDPRPLAPAPALKWQAVKIYVDGVILYPANTGAMLEPYFLPVGNTSIWSPNNSSWPEPYWSTEILSGVLEGLILEGIDAQIHVDGDMAVRVALDSLQSFRDKHGDGYDYRVGPAHNEVTDPSDWPRFAELKADPIMSFQWAQASSVWYPNTIQSMGPVRSNYLEAWGDIAKFGSRIIYGSDWPIDPLDEWLAIKAGVTRSGDPTNPNSPASQDPAFNRTGLPGLSLSREEAIRAITIEAARFLRADKVTGSLEVGKLADVIVLESNYFEVPDDELARQKVLVTMAGGEIMHMADGVDFNNGAVAKFPNNGTLDRRMEKISYGGIQGRSLDEKGVTAFQQLKVRNICDHGIAHSHKHM